MCSLFWGIPYTLRLQATNWTPTSWPSGHIKQRFGEGASCRQLCGTRYRMIWTWRLRYTLNNGYEYLFSKSGHVIGFIRPKVRYVLEVGSRLKRYQNCSTSSTCLVHIAPKHGWTNRPGHQRRAFQHHRGKSWVVGWAHWTDHKGEWSHVIV